MAETSFPTANGGSVTDANYEVLMASATGDGLIGKPSLSPMIYADSSGRQVKVRGNRGGIVRGFRWQTDAAGLTVPVAANSSGQTRIDLVTLRLDRSTYNVRVAVIPGTASSSPTAPAPVYADPPSQYFDMPLAQVTVAAASSPGPVIGAGDVRETTWYLAEPAVAGTTAYTPPSSPGRIFMQADSNQLIVGGGTGGWDTMYRDSGWIDMGVPSGFKAANGIHVRRKGDWCVCNFSVIRTGATIAGTADAVIATMSNSKFWPDITAEGVYYCSNPDHASNLTVSTTGEIRLQGNNTNPINTNAYLWGQVLWPVSW